jgi:hypothetical protein
MAGNLANQLLAGGQIHRLGRKWPRSKNEDRTANRQQRPHIHGKTLTKLGQFALQFPVKVVLLSFRAARITRRAAHITFRAARITIRAARVTNGGPTVMRRFVHFFIRIYS